VNRSRRTAIAATFAVSAGLVAAVRAAFASDRLLHRRKSKYSDIHVVEDDRGFRVLQFEELGSRQSVVRMGDPDHLELAYAQITVAALAAVPVVRKMLVIGLGGGSLPMYFRRHDPDLEIDVVDIDADVLAVARDWFGFREDPKLRVFIDDGRKLVERAKAEYDVIVVDAFSARFIPYSLATAEFLAACRRALTPQGVLVANVWSRSQNRLYDGMVRTYREGFPGFAAVAVLEAENQVFFAWNGRTAMSREELVAGAEAVSRRLAPRFDLVGQVERGYRRPDQLSRGGRVLHDRDGAANRAAGA
jgi:spermidine synthase